MASENIWLPKRQFIDLLERHDEDYFFNISKTRSFYLYNIIIIHEVQKIKIK